MTTAVFLPSPSPPPAMTRLEFLAWLYDKPTTRSLLRRFKPVCSQARLATGLFGHENASGLRRLTTNGRKGATLKGLRESQVHSLPGRSRAAARNQSFRHCAVVGSSSNLLDGSDASAIDAAMGHPREQCSHATKPPHPSGLPNGRVREYAFDEARGVHSEGFR